MFCRPEKSEKESGEGTDRATFTLSGVQMELFRALKAAGKPVIVVLVQGRPLEVGELRADADGLLLAWYPGCTTSSPSMLPVFATVTDAVRPSTFKSE